MRILLVALLVLSACSTKSFSAAQDTSIVRLHQKDGQFFCSGTVISPTQIATAAHCVSEDTPFGVMVDKSAEIEIRGQDSLPTGIIAHIRGTNPRLDTAMLIGDFSHFTPRLIETDPAAIDRILLDPESHIIVCGYPFGSDLVCNRMTKIHHNYFMYSGKGWLYPGMSGGPVIDLRTGKVLAVNRAVDLNEIIVNPLVDFIYDMLRG